MLGARKNHRLMTFTFAFDHLADAFIQSDVQMRRTIEAIKTIERATVYNPKSEKVGTVWKTQIKKESSDF